MAFHIRFYSCNEKISFLLQMKAIEIQDENIFYQDRHMGSVKLNFQSPLVSADMQNRTLHHAENHTDRLSRHALRPCWS